MCDSDGCSDEFTVPNWLDRKRFCSVECAYGNRTGVDEYGEDNPRWSGGRKNRHRGPDWAQKREQALERDFYQCRMCRMDDDDHRDEFGRGLTVHHRTPYDYFDSHERANRLRNLLTLCLPCHPHIEAELRSTL